MPEGFVEADGGGGGEVEGVGLAGRGDGDFVVGLLLPVFAEAEGFVAHDEGVGLGEILIPEGCAALADGGGGLDVVLLKKCGGLFGLGFDDGHGEEEASGGADDVGVEEVDHGVVAKDGVESEGVGGAEDGAEVSGFFGAFEDEEEGLLRELEVFEGGGVGLGHAKQAVRAFSSGDFFEGVRREFELLAGVLLGGVEKGLVFLFQEFRAEEEFLEFSAGFEVVFEFFGAFDEEASMLVPVPFFPESGEEFDFWVLSTLDEFSVHKARRSRSMRDWAVTAYPPPKRLW